ncbi:MAG: hypothetical protein CSA72_01715 [Rhodobacterales bacterium]|nr:MAG: hypothetical protein CSA72_01715 [Rhodobacterales bacterium]
MCAALAAPLPSAVIAQDSAQIAEDKGLITSFLEDKLSNVSRSVTIEGFEGALSSEASIDRLTIADREGDWLVMEDLVLSWTRSALLRGRVDVEQLSAGRIALLRPPVPDPSAPAAEARALKLPELPVSIEIGDIAADRIELGPDFLGEPVTVQVYGDVSLKSGALDTTVNAIRLDDKTGQFIIDLDFAESDGVLALTVLADEGPDGIAARVLDLPGRPSVRLSLDGLAPINDFTADISLETDDTPRLSGAVTLQRSEPVGDAPAAQRVELDLGGDISPLFAGEYGAFFGDDTRLRASAGQRADGSLSLDRLSLSSQALNLTGTALIGADGWPERFSATGAITPREGAPVLLPIKGQPTTVDGMDFAVGYDSAQSPDWTADFALEGLAREGLRIPQTKITGGGQITPPAEGATARWSLGLDYAATGIELAKDGLAEALGDAVSGRIEAHGAEQTPTKIDRITLQGPGLEAEARATIQGADGGYETHAEARLSAQTLSRFSGLAGRDLRGSAELDITANIAPQAPRTELIVSGSTRDLGLGLDDLDKLLTGDGLIRIEAERDDTGTRLTTLDIHTDHAKIDARANLEEGSTEALLIAAIPNAALLSPDLEGEARITATLAKGETQVTVVDVAANLPDGTARIGANIGPVERDYQTALEAELDLHDLASYADLLGRDLNGSAKGTLSGSIGPLTKAGDLTLKFATKDLTIGEARIDPLLHGAGQLDTRVQRDEAGAITVERFSLTTDEVSASGAGQVAKGAAVARFDARLRDAAVLAPELSGPMTLSGTADQDADGRTVVDMRASGPGFNLTGNAIAPRNVTEAPTQFDLSARVDDLSDYSALAGRDLAGAARADLKGSVTPGTGVFDATVEAKTRDLRLEIDKIDALLAGASAINGQVQRRANGDLLIEGLDVETPQARAQGRAELAQGNVFADLSARVEQMALLVPGLNGPAEATLTSEDKGEGKTDLILSGRGPGMTVQGRAQVDSGDAALPAAFNVTAVAGRLSDLRSLIGQPVSGSLRVDAVGTASLRDATGAADVTASTSDLGIGTPIADRILRGAGRLTGRVARDGSGKITARGLDLLFPNLRGSGNGTVAPGGGVSADFEARLADIALINDKLTGPLTATGTARQSGNGSDVNVTLGGPGDSSARIVGRIGNNGQMALTADGQLPLAAANPYIAPRSVEGPLRFDLAVNGPAALSSVTGTLSVEDARFAEPQSGEALEGISGQARLAAGRLAVDLRAAPPRGGTIALTGGIGLSGNLPADLALNADDIVLRDPTLYETTVDGALTMRGPLRGGALIAGQIDLDRTEIRVPSSAIGSLGALPEVRHVGSPPPVRLTLDRAGLSTGGIDKRRGGDANGDGARRATVFPLDITVSAPARVFVRGRGLDAELGGSMRLGGTSRNVIPSGRFELVRGRIDILQQRFDLTEGYATLEGDFSPYIRLVATTDTDSGSASIILEGDASEPEISFASQPELPEDEVLSRLIFGRDLSALTPLQAVQLAAAVNTLAGRGNGGLVGQLRDSVGLDDLDITTSETGNTSLRAGKYLTDNLYTDVTVESDGTSRIDLNLDVSKNLTVRGGSSTDGESSVGIFFERDY